MKTQWETLMESSLIQSVIENAYSDADSSHEIYKWIQKRLRNPMRPYQKQALKMLETLLPIIRSTASDNVGSDFNAPVLAFEMATGSGKTLEMLAHILYLYKVCHVQHFMVVTPGNAIYDKNVANFTPDARDTEWSPVNDLKVNVVTSETYSNPSCLRYEKPDLTIYVYNVQQFHNKPTKDEQDISKGVPYVYRPKEDWVWKDEHDNVVSFVEYLRSRPTGLVILSDEAHHYQKAATKKVISDLEPRYLLEYTATPEHDVQNVVFQYGMRQFITDKYAKRTRILGYGQYPSGIESKAVLLDEDKSKIMLGLMVHQVKRNALDAPHKPLCLIKARQIDHAKEIEVFLKNMSGLPYDEADYRAIFEQVLVDISTSNAPIAKLVLELATDKEALWANVKASASKYLRYDSQTNTTQDVRSALANIEVRQDYEVILAVDALDEGWNVKKLYTIVVLHEGEQEVATSVKQLIGRGIRLYREQRIKDKCTIREQQDELLHIIAVKGRAFDQAIEQIQRELGLTSSELGDEQEEVEEIGLKVADTWTEHCITQFSLKNISKFDRYRSGCQSDQQAYELLVEAFIRERCTSTNILSWLDSICETVDGKRVLGVLPGSNLVEREILEIDDVFTEDQRLTLQDMAVVAITTPSFHAITRQVFNEVAEISSLDQTHKMLYEAISPHLYRLYRAEGVKENRALDKLLKSLASWLAREVRAFWCSVEMDYIPQTLTAMFPNATEFVAKSKLITDVNAYLKQVKHPDIKSMFFQPSFKRQVYGPGLSVDSPFELEMALALDKWLEPYDSDRCGWVRNKRQFTVPYLGPSDTWANYYPDFIVFYGGWTYLIETKGDNVNNNVYEKKMAADSLYREGYPFRYLFLLYSRKDLLKLTSFEEFISKV